MTKPTELSRLRKENRTLRSELRSTLVELRKLRKHAQNLEMWNTIYRRELIDWQQMTAQRFLQ